MKSVPMWLLILLPLVAVLAVTPFAMPLLKTTRDNLLASQQAALDIAAMAIAAQLAGDSRFLEWVDDDVASTYRAVPIAGEIVLDGRAGEWPPQSGRDLTVDQLLAINYPYTAASFEYQLRVGSDDDHLYLHYAVRDDVVVYREIGNLSVHRNDHVQLATLNLAGEFVRYTLAVQQPGEVTVMEVSETGRALRAEPGITGRWMATEDGYQIELKIPRELIGRRFSTLVADVDDPNARAIRYLMGLTHTRSASELGRLVYSPTDLESLVSALPYPAIVTGPRGLAVMNVEFTEDPGLTLESSRMIVAGERPLGVLTIRQSLWPTVYLIESIKRQSLLLVGLTLLMVLVAMLLIALLLNRRLTAMGRQLMETMGNRGTAQPVSKAGGDSFSRLEADLRAAIARIGQQNDYLERMASRLNHELRTPVSVVKSSLENLQGQLQDSATAVYVERASLGVERLTGILNKMAEARRLEEALDEEEIQPFDLAELTRGCVAGYGGAFPEVSFRLNIEADEVPVTGIPELMAQLLDKLIDNAVEFSTSTEVRIRLNVEDGAALLRVMNDGPALPSTTANLFESMVSQRADGDQVDSGNHLGLGLYIARVIAEFHGADLTIANREDSPGVIVTLRVPLLRITAKLR